MRRNSLGEPQPANADELTRAMDEMDLSPGFSQAEIFDGTDNEHPPFDGWVAEISDAETGENRISTLAFPCREALEQVLETVGILLIVEH